MKLQKYSHSAIATLTSVCYSILFLLSSCYKDDAQELYQRQYVTSVALKDLQQQADNINKDVSDLQTVVNNLAAREPISKLIYNTQDTDTLGAYMTLGNTTVYVPFGRDGKDGRDGIDGKDGKDGVSPTFNVSIGNDGFWYINGAKTDKVAQGPKGEDGKDGANGRDACTPVFGVAQDADNTSDPNFYWTVTWCDGSKAFILGNGEKVKANATDGKDGKDGRDGRDGVDGKDEQPGVISPITAIRLNATGDSVIFNTTYPDQPIVRIPLHPDRMFDIQPEKSVDNSGTDLSSNFAPGTNTLTFEPGQAITFPYTKSSSLDKVFINSLPEGWKVAVNNNTITLTAPNLQKVEDVASTQHLTFTARDNNGQAYQRDLIVEMPKAFYINYFFNPSSNVYTQQPNSSQNLFSLPQTGNYTHEFSMYQLMQDGSYNRLRLFTDAQANNITSARLGSYLRENYVYQLPKTDDMDYQTFMFKDFVYETSRLTTGFTSEQSRQDEYVLHLTNFTHSTNKALYVQAIPWNTYGAETVIGPGSGTVKDNKDHSVLTTIRLKRLAQRNLLYLKDPHTVLGIPANEAIDVNRMSVSIASCYGMYANGNYWTDRYGSRAIVTQITGGGINYNTTDDLLTANFCSFPTQNSSSYKLLVEYRTATGQQIRKVITYGVKGNQPQMALAGNGGTVEFRIGVPVVANNTNYASSIWVRQENGNGMIRPIVPAQSVYNYDANIDDF